MQAIGSSPSTSTALFRPAQFAERHRSAGWTEAALRWLIFTAHDNGLGAAGAIIRQGRRVFIDEEKFFVWLRSARAPTDHRRAEKSAQPAR